MDKYSLYPNLLLRHSFIMDSSIIEESIIKWDSDQHESFGYFSHCVHINKLVRYIYFIFHHFC